MPDTGQARAKVAVLVSGAGTNMAALLYASRLPGAAYEIVLVASNNPDAAALKLAEAEGLATFALDHRGMDRAAHDTAMDTAIRQAGAEYIALAGYMRVLGPDMVDRWEGRILNIHPSLLPKYRGLHTHRAALEAGDIVAGCSVHLVTRDLDAGEVLAQATVAIRPDDTEASLADRVRIAEHQLYSRVVSKYVSRPNDPAWLLENIRRLALQLPETHERESHGSPGWRVGSEKSGKFFAYFADQHHGTPHISLLVKTGSMDELEGLVETQPHAYHKPAYYGASGWVGLILNRPGLDWDGVAEWLQRSWRSVAPKGVTRLLDVADEF